MYNFFCLLLQLVLQKAKLKTFKARHSVSIPGYSVYDLSPLFSNNPYVSYQRALLSNAATSALRLHQRLPNFQLSREFFGLLMLEDSAHYLFYSLIFVNSHPVTSILTC